MKRKLSMGSLLIAGALTGFTGQAGASMQSNPDGGMGEISQQKGQQGVGLEGASSSSVILGGPEILLGRIEKIEPNGFLVRGDRGQSVKIQLTKDTNIVCSNGSEAKLVTRRQGVQEQAEIPISPAAEDQVKRHETSTPSNDPSTLKGVVGSTDEAANKDLARGSGFVVGSSDCNFQPGDLVRIEASDVGTMTTITRLAGKKDKSGSQIATEKDEES